MVSFIYSFFFQKASYNFNPWKDFSFCGWLQFMHTPVVLHVPEYSFVYCSVASPASQGTGCFDATKSIEGLKGFYSLAVLLQSTVGCTASLWIDPTVHFWQWIAKIIPSFLQPVVLPSATGLFHGSIYNRILSSKGFFSEDKTKCTFVNSPSV